MEKVEVTVGKDEEDLYCLSRIGESGKKLAKCFRKRWCWGVHKAWLKKAQERESKMKKQKQFAELRAQRVENERLMLEKLKVLFYIAPFSITIREYTLRDQWHLHARSMIMSLHLRKNLISNPKLSHPYFIHLYVKLDYSLVPNKRPSLYIFGNAWTKKWSKMLYSYFCFFSPIKKSFSQRARGVMLTSQAGKHQTYFRW